MKYYEILDIPPSATDEQIRTTYRILVQLHHPDRLQQMSPVVREYAEERLKKINQAYGVLGDPERRAVMGKIGLERMKTALSWEHSAPRLLEAYAKAFVGQKQKA